MFEVFLLPNLAGSKKEEERKNRTWGRKRRKGKEHEEDGKEQESKSTGREVRRVKELEENVTEEERIQNKV